MEQLPQLALLEECMVYMWFAAQLLGALAEGVMDLCAQAEAVDSRLERVLSPVGETLEASVTWVEWKDWNVLVYRRVQRRDSL